MLSVVAAPGCSPSSSAVLHRPVCAFLSPLPGLEAGEGSGSEVPKCPEHPVVAGVFSPASQVCSAGASLCPASAAPQPVGRGSLS